MRLEKKTALVTGANSGIGKAIADRFAAEGAQVSVNYLPGGDRQAQAEAQAAGYTAGGLAVGADVSKRSDVEEMVRQTIARFGRLDIVVNNAGIEMKKPFLEVTDEEWQRVLAVNLDGPFYVTQTAVHQMVAQGGSGRIINISSTHEDISFPGYTAYCVSKGGLRMFTRNLAIELAPHKITINNIAPGAIATSINKSVLDDPKERQEAVAEVPLGRFGTPDEVAGLAVYLASDEAGYATGSTYYLDGGLSQQVTAF